MRARGRRNELKRRVAQECRRRRTTPRRRSISESERHLAEKRGEAKAATTIVGANGLVASLRQVRFCFGGTLRGRGNRSNSGPEREYGDLCGRRPVKRKSICVHRRFAVVAASGPPSTPRRARAPTQRTAKVKQLAVEMRRLTPSVMRCVVVRRRFETWLRLRKNFRRLQIIRQTTRHSCNLLTSALAFLCFDLRCDCFYSCRPIDVKSLRLAFMPFGKRDQ